MKANLKKSPVVFDSATHTYLYGGAKLSGITSILSRYLFPSKYDGVKKEVLDAAAAHGSLIHSQIENLVNNKRNKKELAEYIASVEPEVRDYLQLIKDNKIKMIQSEYLVSDDMWVASSIDLVDENYNLYDIKTTSTFDSEYVRWQLSVYASLFEYVNPDLQAGKLYGIHLRNGEAKLVEVDRIPTNIIQDLINAYAFNEETFENPLNTIGENEDDIVSRLKLVRKQKSALEEEEKNLLEMIRNSMMERGSYSIKKPNWSASVGKDTFKMKFDEKRFKEEKLSMWSKYAIMAKQTGKFIVTIKDKEE